MTVWHQVSGLNYQWPVLAQWIVVIFVSCNSVSNLPVSSMEADDKVISGTSN